MLIMRVQFIVNKESFFHHRRAVLLVAILITILVFSSTYAYYRSLPPPSVPRASIISWPLNFQIEIDKTEYLQGENASIILTLSNISNETISLTWAEISYAPPPSNGTFSFHITDANENLVYDWLEFRVNATELLIRTLAPGDSLTAVFVWEQQTRTGQYPRRFAPAVKGTYGIRGYTSTMQVQSTHGTVNTSLEPPSISFAIA